MPELKGTKTHENLVEAFKGADPQENLGRTVTADEILERGAVRLEGDSVLAAPVRSVLSQTLGTVQLGLGNGEEAVRWLERALEVDEERFGAEDPRLAPTLVELVNAWFAVGEYERAEAAARRAVGLMPEDPPASKIQARHLHAEGIAALGRRDEAATSNGSR